MEIQRSHLKRKSFNKGIKITAIVLWGLFLSIHTWTKSLEELLLFHSVGFMWDLSPNLMSFFKFHDFALTDPVFLKIKSGLR
jgi:hypothetical protein